MKVSELMSDEVLSVGPETPLRAVAALLVEHGISGVPVCDESGAILGVVSETDIVTKERGRAERHGGLLGWMLEPSLATTDEKALARTAGEAMTSPAVTVAPYRSVIHAARKMLDEDVNRLPVVGAAGRLVGIVTRADLVRAFARPDEEIAREIRDDVVSAAIWADPDSVEIDVEDGVVSLTGRLDRKSEALLLTVLAQRVPGVVSVESDVSYREDDTRRRFARA